MLTWCQEALVKYKRPVGVQVLEELPRTGVSTLDKRRLRNMAREDYAG